MNTTNTQHNPGKDSEALAVLFLSMASAHEERAANGEPLVIQEQRELGHRKATKLDARVVHEFVEIGVAATDRRKRPALQAMFAYLGDHPEVRYAIFPGLHRVSRNSLDFIATAQRFRDLGVDIVSAMDAGGDPLSAEARDEFMLGIAHSMADGLMAASERSELGYVTVPAHDEQIAVPATRLEKLV